MTRKLDPGDRVARFVGPVPVTVKDPDGEVEDVKEIYEGWYHPAAARVVPVRVLWQRPTDKEIQEAIEAAVEGRDHPGIRIRRPQIPTAGPRPSQFGYTPGPAAVAKETPAANTRPKFDGLRKAANELTFWTVAAALVAAVGLARRIRRG